MQQNESGRIRAIVLTTQRTGSTFLVDCLRSHPEIECASEILIGEPDDPRPSYRGPFRQVYKIFRIAGSGAWRPARHIHRFFKRGTAKVRCFKVMYNQLAWPFARRFLVENESIRVIHLRRENLLKVHVSTLLMSMRSHVQAKSKVDPVWVHVDPKKAISSIKQARARYEAHELVFRRHARLAVTYENLIEGQGIKEDTRSRICEFLDVEQMPMGSPIMKLNPESLRDMVTNYDELADAISQTEFADMLD